MSLSNYLKETKTEMTHVSWPSRSQAIAFTVIVILVTVIAAAFLGFFDYLFSLVIKALVI